MIDTNEHYKSLARLAAMVARANAGVYGRHWQAEQLIASICFKYRL